MSRGFVILAFNTTTTKYSDCAITLAESIKRTMPTESVCVITDKKIRTKLFDEQIIVESVDDSNWKLSNDHLVYDHTPYQHTIKLESDLFIPRRIDHWWSILKNRHLNICTTIRNYRGEISTVDYYRQMMVKNKLPDTYNALTYFQKGELASEFYSLVKDIFTNWKSYSNELSYCVEDSPTTDTVYGIAAKIIGEEWCILPTFTDMSMTHMKPMINNTGHRWADELVLECNGEWFKINCRQQRYPVHYHIKEYSKMIRSEVNG